MNDNCTVMVVDHTSSSRKSIIKTIRQELPNAQLIESSSSQHALSLLRETSKVNAILSELDLNDGAGVEFILAAKQIASAKDASFMVMTSRRDRDALMRAAAAGVSDYLLKPFNGNTLTIKLRKLVHLQLRSSERVSLFETTSTTLKFDTHPYHATIIDISLGGCLLRSQVFSQGGCIYDIADITVNDDNLGPIPLQGVLVRAERDPEANDKRTMLAAFQFCTQDPAALEQLSRFIATTKSVSLK
ncbi:MAG: response regulator [Gammaproteobacteria bacterium]|nr:response regulator [Gammaproteobacteria bacterium]